MNGFLVFDIGYHWGREGWIGQHSVEVFDLSEVAS